MFSRWIPSNKIDLLNQLKFAIVNRKDTQAEFARLSLFSLGLISLLMVSGTLIRQSGAGWSCTGWPLCNPWVDGAGVSIWLVLAHRLIVVVAGIALLLLLLRAWRTQGRYTSILVSTTAAVVLFFAQALLGAEMVQGFPFYLLVLHRLTSLAVWGLLVYQTILAGMLGWLGDERVHEKILAQKPSGLLKDLFALTKPVVVALLLVTTYAGMILAGQEIPPLSLTIWTLIGGFLAAGGSGAINQYIDREDDLLMQRTQKRPIPAGRLSPAQGLAFGVGMVLSAFYVMVAFVNWPAALLTLVGIVYYVVLYSMLLKKTTENNIVIGGGAGAIPPLVGWAAVTGNITIAAIFLFVLVFIWTPPHFWALALVRRKDYARAGVPMLPVARGETETRKQIFVYTLVLVGFSFFWPVVGFGSLIYMAGAAILGFWLIQAAWKVWRWGGNRLAWKMYRYSSMYLAFLFVTLVVDALLK